MAEHFSQKIRKILDAPMCQKGFVFWLISPLLILISFVWALIAFIKRFRGYKKLGILKHLPTNLKIICFGNILVGGTGKTPIVRTYAQNRLQDGNFIAIASRGIHGKSVIVNSKNYILEDLNALSDENREHFELLKHRFPDSNFVIYQNKNRLGSLLHFIETIRNHSINQKCVFILDDGLQHFSCPRHINVCVCDANVDGIALPFALPFGPYREGFGKQSVQHLLNKFDVCLWPQKTKNSSNALLADTKFPFNHSKNISVSYKLKFVKCSFSREDSPQIENLTDNFQQFKDFDNSLVLAGIAHPDRFYQSLIQIDKNFEKSTTLFLPDHGFLTEQNILKIYKFSCIFLTLKDFYRFISNPDFINIAWSKTIYGCYLEYDLSLLDV